MWMLWWVCYAVCKAALAVTSRLHCLQYSGIHRESQMKQGRGENQTCLGCQHAPTSYRLHKEARTITACQLTFVQASSRLYWKSVIFMKRNNFVWAEVCPRTEKELYPEALGTINRDPAMCRLVSTHLKCYISLQAYWLHQLTT